MQNEKVERLIDRHINYKREVNKVWDGLDEGVKGQSITLEFLASGISKIRELTFSHGIEVQKSISKLGEPELSMMVEAEDTSYDFDSKRAVERLDAISDLFEYILFPTKRILDAHSRHCEKIGSKNS